MASKLHLAVDSGGWFWKNGVIIKHKPADFNKEADERHTDTISRWITGGFGPKQKSGERKTITDKLLEDFNAKYCINIAIHK